MRGERFMEPTKILIVDDSAVVRKSLIKLLEEMGAKVTAAEDGEQGLDIALSNQFDLIITDVEMPKMGGYTLCLKLKNNPSTRGIPIIILSTQDSDEAIERGFQAGATAYISKSEAMSQLKKTIGEVLDKSSFKQERSILVVDDSKTIRFLVEKGLSEAGFHVLTATNGKEGLKMIKIKEPDLILSDINMPEMDGIEFCKHVKADPDWAAVPFVVMSSHSERSLVRGMIDQGATTYIVKPFNLEQLVVTIENLLSDSFLNLLKDKERLDSERKMMLKSIIGIVMSLEARHSYAEGHSRRVAKIVSGMAEEMKMKPEDIEMLKIAAKIHNLGYISVPDKILLKPGKLTVEEYDVMKEHPVVGAEIIGTNPALKDIVPALRNHHERYDGFGYPDGLKKDEPHLWARMIAVADTFDAITSIRPYRSAQSREYAIDTLNEVRGIQLCPECVDVFLTWLESAPKKL
jgi:response regulator RpfG family c-di-GMP phosphodiesterase